MAAVSKYPAELKERAVAMARELERELGPGRGAIARVAAQLGIHPRRCGTGSGATRRGIHRPGRLPQRR